MRVTVPLVAPLSMKSPTAKGRVSSSVTPANTFESVFCSERLSARPATLTSATSEVVEIFSLPIMISAAVTHSTARSTVITKRFTASSSRVLSKALRVNLTHSLISTRQTSKISAEASIFPSEKPPMSVLRSCSSVSPIVFSGMSAPPFQDSRATKCKALRSKAGADILYHGCKRAALARRTCGAACHAGPAVSVTWTRSLLPGKRRAHWARPCFARPARTYYTIPPGGCLLPRGALGAKCLRHFHDLEPVHKFPLD